MLPYQTTRQNSTKKKTCQTIYSNQTTCKTIYQQSKQLAKQPANKTRQAVQCTIKTPTIKKILNYQSKIDLVFKKFTI